MPQPRTARQLPAGSARQRTSPVHRLPPPADRLPLLPGQPRRPPPPAARDRRDRQDTPHQILQIHGRPSAAQELVGGTSKPTPGGPSVAAVTAGSRYRPDRAKNGLRRPTMSCRDLVPPYGSSHLGRLRQQRPLDESRIHHAFDERGMRQDALVKRSRRFDALDP